MRYQNYNPMRSFQDVLMEKFTSNILECNYLVALAYRKMCIFIRIKIVWVKMLPYLLIDRKPQAKRAQVSDLVPPQNVKKNSGQ